MAAARRSNRRFIILVKGAMELHADSDTSRPQFIVCVPFEVRMISCSPALCILYVYEPLGRERRQGPCIRPIGPAEVAVALHLLKPLTRPSF